MEQWIWKDYFLHGRWLVKKNLNESKHLLWRYGGVPCIDKRLYDSLNADGVVIRTNKGRIFKADKQTIDKNMILINDGYGQQITIPKSKWNIIYTYDLS